MNKVWISKVSQIKDNQVLYTETIGVFSTQEKAVLAALKEAPAEYQPFEEEEYNDIYVRYVGKEGWSVVADCWSVL